MRQASTAVSFIGHAAAPRVHLYVRVHVRGWVFATAAASTRTHTATHRNVHVVDIVQVLVAIHVELDGNRVRDPCITKITSSPAELAPIAPLNHEREPVAAAQAEHSL